MVSKRQINESRTQTLGRRGEFLCRFSSLKCVSAARVYESGENEEAPSDMYSGDMQRVKSGQGV